MRLVLISQPSIVFVVENTASPLPSLDWETIAFHGELMGSWKTVSIAYRTAFKAGRCDGHWATVIKSSR